LDNKKWLKNSVLRNTGSGEMKLSYRQASVKPEA